MESPKVLFSSSPDREPEGKVLEGLELWKAIAPNSGTKGITDCVPSLGLSPKYPDNLFEGQGQARYNGSLNAFTCE